MDNKYQKIKNNLLFIKSKDRNIRISLNKKHTYNLHNILTTADLKKVFTESRFKVNVNNIFNGDFFKEIRKIHNAKNFIDFCSQKDENIPKQNKNYFLKILNYIVKK